VTIEARKIRLIMHLRKSGVVDTAVLSALERIPREAFLPSSFHDQAYEDMALPIGLGQTISQPLVVALMTQELRVGDRLKVLEIGTGSGYQTAVLSKLARRVYTIERHRPLLKAAEAVLEQLRIRNVTTRCADGTRGWPEQAPFDRVIVTAAAQGEVPKDLTDQLAVGGVLVIPVAVDRRDQRVVRVTRTPDGLEREELWPVRFVPLIPEPPDSPGGRAE
jgi:protein-L-isoaspartate(D-aspartate) O-methyltransferase